MAAALSLVILCSLCLYLLEFVNSHRDETDTTVGLAGYLNMSVFWGVLAAAACPFPILYHHTRFWFWRTMWSVVRAGMLTVDFRSLFMADQLTS